MENPLEHFSAQDKIVATVLAYYRRLEGFVVTAQELATWFDRLPAPERLPMHTLGLRLFHAHLYGRAPHARRASAVGEGGRRGTIENWIG